MVLNASFPICFAFITRIEYKFNQLFVIALKFWNFTYYHVILYEVMLKLTSWN